MGYYRWWLQFDGPILKAIDRDGLDSDNTLRIANAYSVARTFGGTDKTRWNDIASRINCLAKKWPADLQSRARCCIATAQEIRRYHGGQAPYSGVTKLIWFLRPDGWTIYDSFAANALITGGGDGSHRVARFYEALGDNLAELSRRIAPDVAAVEPALRPERVIDQYLMLRGMRGQSRKQAIQEINDRLACMPPRLQSSIRDACSRIAVALKDALPRQGSRKISR